jgi:hypothetical protein
MPDLTMMLDLGVSRDIDSSLPESFDPSGQGVVETGGRLPWGKKWGKEPYVSQPIPADLDPAPAFLFGS